MIPVRLNSLKKWFGDSKERILKWFLESLKYSLINRESIDAFLDKLFNRESGTVLTINCTFFSRTQNVILTLTLLVKSESVTIQMKAIEKHFLVALLAPWSVQQDEILISFFSPFSIE